VPLPPSATGEQDETVTRLRTEIAGVSFANPVWVGSSEATMSLDDISACIDAGAGAVIAKSINEDAAAARQLDIADYVFLDDRYRRVTGGPGSSLFNRSGLAQTTLDDWLRMLERAQAHASSRGSAVIGSITVASADAAGRLARALGDVVPLVEVNVGAPHGREASGGAVRRLTETEGVAELVATVRAATTGPLIVKLPSTTASVPALAVAARDAGADAVAMIGRFTGFVPDPEGEPLLGSWGAYSGPWALPISLYEVSKTYRTPGFALPLIGTNGARDADDVLRFVVSGARAVELVSIVWTEGPAIITRIVEELERLLADRDETVEGMVGRAADRARGYAEIDPVTPRPEPWRR
jgi:dihydroorotate dehydrogenase